MNVTADLFMTFEHDQDKNPAIIAYTRELFARYEGTEADKCLVQYMRAQARRYQHLISGPNTSHHMRQIARSRRQWLLHLLSVADRSVLHLRPFIARVIVEGQAVGAAHGDMDARSAASATGAAPAASVVAPHGNHGDNQA